MALLKFVLLPLLLLGMGSSQAFTANSQPQPLQNQPQPQQQLQQHQAPQVQPHQQAQNIQDTVISAPLDTAETPVTNHYPYQSTALSPSSYHHPSYPSSSTYGNRDVGWGSSPSPSQGGWSNNTPYFGITTGTGWELTAYIGPVAWAFFAVIATFGFCVGIGRLFLGSDIFGGMFQRIKDAAPSGKSLDLDNVTNFVYQALDTYGKYAAKEARDGSTQSMKG